MKIDLHDADKYLNNEERETIIKLIKFVSEKENINQNLEVSIAFINNEKIQELNKLYRQIDEPTDCLSFPYIDNLLDNKKFFLNKNIQPQVLGDIFISIEKAKSQAKQYNHSFLRELGFLIVHSLLHLIGYDHNTKEEEKQMFSKQEALLGAFGLERK